jgi:hypothetical protein
VRSMPGPDATVRVSVYRLSGSPSLSENIIHYRYRATALHVRPAPVDAGTESISVPIEALTSRKASGPNGGALFGSIEARSFRAWGKATTKPPGSERIEMRPMLGILARASS